MAVTITPGTMFLSTLRSAARSLRRSPGFSTAVLLTLALGVGVNATTFAVVDRLMFRPYPMLRDPSAVHRVYFRADNRGVRVTRADAEYARYLDVVRWTRSFSQTAGFSNRTMAVGAGAAARERRVAVVSGTFFGFFDARPALGRFFTPDEDRTPRGADVAVLGYAFWRQEFGGRDVRGEVLQVGNVRATVVGVAPEGFVGVSDDEAPAVYIPMTTFAGAQPDRRDATRYYNAYYWRWMEIMVRRAPGVSVAQASADASRAARRSWEARRVLEPDLPPADVAKPEAIVSALRTGAGPDPSLEARTALWLGGVALAVLLIACANVANLFLVRALRRHRETAVRLALGVARRRLAAETLAESLLLALAGTALGVLVAQWAAAAVRRLLVGASDVSLGALDWRLLGVATALGVASGLATGLVPAALSGRDDLARSLRAGARGGTRHRSRTRAALLVTQGALSAALLVGASLFVRSLANVRAMRLGFDADPVLVVRSNLRGTTLDADARAGLGRALLAAAQSLPGVDAASRVMTVPLLHTNSTHLDVPGVDSVDALGFFSYQAATPEYFRTMGTRVVRGRGFTASDRAGAARVVVVSASMARTLWPGQDALGKQLRIFRDTMPWATVVGVAEDIVQRDVASSERLHYYVPLEQYWPSDGLSLLVRVRGDPGLARERVRAALQSVMPGDAYVTVRPMRELVDEAERSWRLGATTFTALGALALLVAAVGLYGVVGYDVSRRRHELSVRVALGARSGDVVGLVVGQGTRLTAAGVGAGALLALLASRWLQPLLFGQSATDPRVYVAVAAAMLGVALAACVAPALRAARADPNDALRAE